MQNLPAHHFSGLNVNENYPGGLVKIQTAWGTLRWGPRLSISDQVMYGWLIWGLDFEEQDSNCTNALGRCGWCGKLHLIKPARAVQRAQ